MEPDSLNLTNCHNLFLGGGWNEKGKAMKLFLKIYGAMKTFLIHDWL